MAWKKISSKQIYKNRWIEVTEEVAKNNFGKNFIYGIVRKKPFALIIPWDGKRFTLVGQYRYAVKAYSWEFPQGHYQKNSIIRTAKIELREETGLEAKKIKKIGKIYLAPGLPTNQICHIFLATQLIQKKNRLEESEADMMIKKITKNQFYNLVKKGGIKDGPTIAAFGMANNSF